MLKVVLAILFALLAKQYNWGDSFRYFTESNDLTQLLPDHPLKFIRLVFGPTIQIENLNEQYLKALNGELSTLYDDKRNGFLLRTMAVIRLFGGNNFWVQTIFFAFFSFVGIFQIFNFFDKFLLANKNILKFFVFFTPSIAFWSSGVHKDALAFLFMGLTLGIYHQFQQTKKWIYIPIMFVPLYLGFLSRDYTFLLFSIAIGSYFIAQQFKTNFIFPIIYLIGFFGLVISEFLHNNLIETIATAQQVFLAKTGNSTYNVKEIGSSIFSFLESLPYNLVQTILQPNPFTAKSGLALLAGVENWCLLLLGMIGITSAYKWKQLSRSIQQAVLFCFCFSISYLVLIASVVNNSGALIRYKTSAIIYLGIGMILLMKPIQFSIKKLKQNVSK